MKIDDQIYLIMGKKYSSFKEKIDANLKAYELLPLPKESYHLSTLIIGSVVGDYLDEGLFNEAKKWEPSLVAAYGKDDPHTIFEQGRICFGLNQLSQSFEKFDVLYKQYKKRPFQGSDPKYLKFYLEEAARRKINK